MPIRFTPELLDRFRQTKYLYVRSGGHRFICVWVIVVDDRVIVRSWNDEQDGWYRAFLSEPNGHVRFGKESQEVPVRAVRLRSTTINDRADDAYAAKYTTKPNQKYVIGFRETHRKACTLELLPA